MKKSAWFYWIPGYGETEDDARGIGLNDWENDPSDARGAAQRAAEHFHAHGSGWEATWPVEIGVVRGQEPGEVFSVDRDLEPVFTASKLRHVAGKVG